MAIISPVFGQTSEEAMIERLSRESQLQIEAYIVREARRQTDRVSREVAAKDEWHRFRHRRRTEMLDMLGLDPMPERGPLRPRITGVIDRGAYRIEKLAFESAPGIYVTANLYVPSGGGPWPTVVYVCGHDRSPHGNKTVHQDYPIMFAKHGYVSLILDSIQIAETFALHHGVSSLEMYDWYSRGYTPSGVEVWNIIRALDYLETRSEVDPARMGITGRSGGAARSWFAGAVDDRLKVVVPVMGIGTFGANLSERQWWRRHCDCMFLINVFRHDMLHQGALISPRPLRMVHGSKDLLFPAKGFQEFEAVIGKLYASYGAGDRFDNVVVPTAHEDSPFVREQTLRWFDRWLKRIPEREIDLSYQELPREQLAVFQGKPPEAAQNYRVHETWTAGTPMASFATPAAWRKRRTELVTVIRELIFGYFPDEPSEVRARTGRLPVSDGYRALEFESEQGVTIHAAYKAEPDRSDQVGGDNAPALLYVASENEDWSAARLTVRNSARTNPVMIVLPRGAGPLTWPKYFWKTILRSSMHLGRSVASMRVWDVMRAARLLRKESGATKVVVYGQAHAGVLGLYAAILDESIDQVILHKPPASHRNGPYLLHIQRYTDLPEVAALLAPRRLTFYSSMPEAYAATQKIYSLFPERDRIGVSMAVWNAVNGIFHHNLSSGQ